MFVWNKHLTRLDLGYLSIRGREKEKNVQFSQKTRYFAWKNCPSQKIYLIYLTHGEAIIRYPGVF